MGGYIDVPITKDPTALSASALDELVALIPGWVPQEGHLEVWLIEILARMTSEAAIVASSVPRSIFRYFGKSLLNVQPIEPAVATVQSTWTMIDTQGYTIPVGTVVAFKTAGDKLIPFRTLVPVVVSPGLSATLAGSVQLNAIEPGVAGNGLTGAMTLVSSLASVLSVAATTISSGGVAGESDDSYLNRLAQELELLTPRPILARDFAILSRRIAGVHRGLGLDGYNPADQTSNNERMVAVAVVSATGTALSAAVKTAVDDYLEAMREVNFIINIIDPTFTTINVVTTFTKSPLFDTAALQTIVQNVILAYLSPATWGGGDLDPPEWQPGTNKVRYLELATLINGVIGVDYVLSLTINGGTVDVTLAGVAPLPASNSTASATVVV